MVVLCAVEVAAVTAESGVFASWQRTKRLSRHVPDVEGLSYELGRLYHPRNEHVQRVEREALVTVIKLDVKWYVFAMEVVCYP